MSKHSIALEATLLCLLSFSPRPPSYFILFYYLLYGFEAVNYHLTLKSKMSREMVGAKMELFKQDEKHALGTQSGN